MTNHYRVLNVQRTASASEIKKAYYKLAFKFHPDRNSGNKIGEEFLKKVNAAYEILSNEAKRKRYDLQLNLYEISIRAKENKKNQSTFASSKKENRYVFDISKMSKEELVIYALIKIFFK